MNGERKREAIIGGTELIPATLLVLAVEAGRTAGLPPWVRHLWFAVAFLAATDGALRLLYVLIGPPREWFRWYRGLMLLLLGTYLAAIEVDRLGLYPAGRSAEIILGAAALWIGVTLPPWIRDHYRLQWIVDAFGAKGVRWFYLGIGVLLIGLGLFATGVPLRFGR